MQYTSKYIKKLQNRCWIWHDYIRSNPSDGVLKELKQSHIFKTEKRRGLTKPMQELLLNHPIYDHW